MKFRLRRKDDSESAHAILDAEKNLREVQARSEEVSAVAKQTHELRIRNHFAEQLTQAISPDRRKRPT